MSKNHLKWRVAVVAAMLMPPSALADTSPLASAAAAAPSPAGGEPPQPQPALQARQIEVGRWPEGVAVAGASAWVAVSGSRRLARVDLSHGKVASRVAVGRLPVELALAGDALYALARTDRTVWKVDVTSAQAKVFATLPDDAEGMAMADGALWFLLWPGGSSAAPAVLRLDLETRAVKRSGPLGPQAFALAVGRGHVFVCHGSYANGPGHVSMLDQATLERTASIDTGPGNPVMIAVGNVFVYAADGATLIQLDLASGQITRRATLPERIAAIDATGDPVLVATSSSTVWQLDGASLATRAAWTLPPGAGEPRALTHQGKIIYLTRSTSDAPAPPGTLVTAELSP